MLLITTFGFSGWPLQVAHLNGLPGFVTSSLRGLQFIEVVRGLTTNNFSLFKKLLKEIEIFPIIIA